MIVEKTQPGPRGLQPVAPTCRGDLSKEYGDDSRKLNNSTLDDSRNAYSEKGQSLAGLGPWRYLATDPSYVRRPVAQ